MGDKANGLSKRAILLFRVALLVANTAVLFFFCVGFYNDKVKILLAVTAAFVTVGFVFFEFVIIPFFENTRRERESEFKMQAEQNKLLYNISASFSSVKDFSQGMNKSFDMIGKFLTLDYIYIDEVINEDEILKRRFEWLDKSALPENKTESGYLCPDTSYENQMQFCACNDTYKESKENTDKYRAFVNIPIIIDEKFWGVFGVCMLEAAREWSQSELGFLRAIAFVFSVNIENVIAQRLLAKDNLEVVDALSKLEAIIKNYPGIIWCVNKNKMVTLLDGKGLKKIGLDPINIIGKNIRYVRGFFPLLEDSTAQMFMKQGSNSWTVDLGKTILNCISADLYDGDKNIIGQLGIANDITETVNMQTELRDAIAAAENASTAKSDFLSRMSHEIRTPMNAIIGMNKIASGTDNIEKMHYCLEKIDDASKHLLGIINDILDLSKIEANKFDISVANFNLERMLVNICTVVTVKIDEKNQNFFIDLDKNIPKNIIGDELRLTQIITNLITNAVKFTDNGGTIKLLIKEQSREENKSTLLFSIVDNGIGISKEQQQRLFQAFEQAEGGTARKYGGTGLGLAICKKLVELMNGEIWLESKLSEGTTFNFTIEVEHGEEIYISNEIAGDVKNTDINSLNSFQYNFSRNTVLFAEDVEINREIIATLLEDTRITVVAAENGQIAVDKFKENPDKYDLILMDVHMPVMDGYEATKIIREMSFSKASEIPIIAMTANAFKEDIENCLQSGMNDHIAKPVDCDVLLKKLHFYLKNVKKATEQEENPVRKKLNYNDYIEFIDIKKGLLRINDNKKLYLSLLKSYIGQQMLEELEEHIKKSDIKKALVVAGALKGVAANLSFPAVFAEVSRIEKKLERNSLSGISLVKLFNVVEETTELINKILKSGEI